MPSDLKRILIAAALAAAAFNATAPAGRAAHMPAASPMPAVAEMAPPALIAEHRPSRIRIGKCAEEDGVPFTNLVEI
jgi:hypothetical protein